MNDQPNNTPILQTDNLHFSYTQKHAEPLHILRGVSLTLYRGESVAIVGASGSGKSTLMHILGGLDIPNQGEVTLCGQKFSSVHDSERTQLRNRYLGFIYQFHHLLAEFSTQENVAMPLKIRGIRDSIAMQKSAEILDKVGLLARCKHKPGELSGGERQRAAIARALVHSPQCLLADEPTGNLDTANADSVFQLMRTLVSDQQGAMIIVTHDMTLARQMDRLLYLKNGVLVAQ